MAVDRVLLDPHGGELGEDHVGDPGVDEEPETVAGVLDHHELAQLVADPLGRHDLEAIDHRRDGGDQLGVRAQPVPGDEARRPHHPERIVAERHLGPEGRAQHPGGQVGDAPVRVDELRLLARARR